MNQTDLFETALGIQNPWHIDRIRLDENNKILEIYVNFQRGARFTCPECGAQDCPAYDTKETTWRHLDFFGYETHLHARHPRVNCQANDGGNEPEAKTEGCGIRRVEVPWARPGSGFTFLFEAMIMSMAPHMPVNASARHVNETDKCICACCNTTSTKHETTLITAPWRESASTRRAPANSTPTSRCSWT